MIRKRRLLFLVNVDWFFVSHRSAVPRAAKSAGWDVHLATTFTKHAAELEADGFIIHEIPLKRGLQEPLDALLYMFRVLFLSRRIRPDIVHTVTIVPNLIGGLGAQFAKVPVIVFAISGLGYHFTQNDQRKQKLSARAARLMYRFDLRRNRDRVIFQNESDCEEIEALANLPADRSLLLPGMGVSLKTFFPCPETKKLEKKRPIVLFAARHLCDNGLREFVEVARILSAQIDAKFVVVGAPDEGNPACVSEKELSDWKAEGLIEWLGQRSDMADQLRNAEIYVLPSYREGFPKRIMEASACGIPTITTDVPRCRDAIRPDVTGLLVPVADARALSTAIKKLVEDPQLRADLGRNARAEAQDLFDMEKIAGRHIKLYETCL